MLIISRDVVRSFSNLGKVHNEIYSSWEENLKNLTDIKNLEITVMLK